MYKNFILEILNAYYGQSWIALNNSILPYISNSRLNYLY